MYDYTTCYGGSGCRRSPGEVDERENVYTCTFTLARFVFESSTSSYTRRGGKHVCSINRKRRTTTCGTRKSSIAQNTKACTSTCREHHVRTRTIRNRESKAVRTCSSERCAHARTSRRTRPGLSTWLTHNGERAQSTRHTRYVLGEKKKKKRTIRTRRFRTILCACTLRYVSSVVWRVPRTAPRSLRVRLSERKRWSPEPRDFSDGLDRIDELSLSESDIASSVGISRNEIPALDLRGLCSGVGTFDCRHS